MTRSIIANKEIPTISLSPKEVEAYEAETDKMLGQTMKLYERFSESLPQTKWELVRKSKCMAIYRDLEQVGDPRQRFYIGVGSIDGTLHETMDGLYSDNTHDLRCMKTHLKHSCIDAGVMHVAKKRSSKNPFRFSGIKWFAARAAWGVVKHQDALTYERTGLTTDSRGNEIGYHILCSIERPEWPADNIPGIKRGSTSSVYLYRPSIDGRSTDAFLSGDLYGIGIIAKIAEYVIAGKWLNVVRAPSCSKAKRLSRMIRDNERKTMSVSKYQCDVCHEKGNVFSSLQTCKACNKKACKHCCGKHTIFEADMRKRRPLAEYFCSMCMCDPSFRYSPEESAMSSYVRSGQTGDMAKRPMSKEEPSQDDSDECHPVSIHASLRRDHRNHRSGHQVKLPSNFSRSLPPPIETKSYSHSTADSNVYRPKGTSESVMTSPTSTRRGGSGSLNLDSSRYQDILSMMEALDRGIDQVHEQLKRNEQVMH